MHNLKKSLYERIGGEFTINAIVDEFYSVVLSDDRLNYFFDNISIDQQIQKLKIFLKISFSEEGYYTKEKMRSSHSALVDRGLNDTHVDLIISHMSNVLKAHNVPDNLIQEATAKLEIHRDDVLNR